MKGKNNPQDVPQKKGYQQNPYFYVSILFGAIVVFGFSFWQVQQNIFSPFEIESSNKVVNTENQQLDLTSEEQIAKLKKQDTDQDGLSDYLELYVYGTSAYIADSDSDGKSDKDEILDGDNPLCDNKGNCQSLNINVATNTTGAEDLVEVNEDMDTIRSTLLQYGYEDSELDLLAEDQLKALYLETITTYSSPEEIDQEVNSLLNPENLSSLSADEIRELLIAGGATEEQLSNISDEQIIEIFQQVVSEQYNQ